MVLKNAAIVAGPLLACTNRDSGGSSVSACQVYLFWGAEGSLRSVCFICPVLWSTILSETLEPCMSCFAVFPLLAKRKEKSHMEQSREIKHGTSSLVTRPRTGEEYERTTLGPRVWRRLLTFSRGNASTLRNGQFAVPWFTSCHFFAFFFFSFFSDSHKVRRMTCAYTTRFSTVWLFNTAMKTHFHSWQVIISQ